MERLEESKITTHLVQLCFYAVGFIVAACLILNHVIYTRTVQRWKKSNMPYLRPIFLLGHKYFLRGYQYSSQVMLDRVYRENENKDMVAFFALTTPTVLVKDPKLIRYIFAKSFDKTYQGNVRALKNDVEMQYMINFASDKTAWQTGRTHMKPAFSASKLYGAAEFAKIKKQINKVLRYVETTASEGQPIDAWEMSQNFVIDSFVLLCAGVDQDSFQKKTEFYDIISDFTALSSARLLKFCLMFLSPAFQYFGIFQIIEPRYKNFFRKVLTEHMTHRRKFSLNHNDFIDYLMSLQEKGFTEANKDNFDNLPDDSKGIPLRQLVGYSIAMFMIGANAIPFSLIYTMHLLSLHPEYQNKIKEEIEETMAKHQVTEFTAEVIKDLQFTEQCILESERLLPMASAIGRYCTEDIQIPGSAVSLKKGDQVLASPYSMHRDPKYFRDPEKFDPERFSPQNKDSISPEVFLAFGYGPRKCPGYKQGNFMAVYFLAALMQKYEIQPHSHPKQMDATDFHPSATTNHPRRAIFVKAIRRKTAAL